MTIRVKQSIIFILLLIILSSASFAQSPPMNKEITVEQYIYSLMKTLSIEPSDKSIDGMARYTDEANKRYWTDMYTPQPLSRPLEKHEMIDFAVDALREKGNIEYGNPPEIHKMVKDFKDVPFRSRISTVIAINMGLVELNDNGELNPLEKVSVQDASKFLKDVKEAYEVYPNYTYKTKLYPYAKWEHGYGGCIFDGIEYRPGLITNEYYSVEKGIFEWNGLRNIGDFPFRYSDVDLSFSHKTNYVGDIKSSRELLIIIYKPGPVLHSKLEDGKVIERGLHFDIDPIQTMKRLEIVKELCREYYPKEDLDILIEYLKKHTSEGYLKDEDINDEKIIVGDNFYGFGHYLNRVLFWGGKISETSEDLSSAKVIEYEKQ